MEQNYPAWEDCLLCEGCGRVLQAEMYGEVWVDMDMGPCPCTIYGKDWQGPIVNAEDSKLSEEPLPFEGE